MRCAKKTRISASRQEASGKNRGVGTERLTARAGGRFVTTGGVRTVKASYRGPRLPQRGVG